jgi:hypothetical protein
MNDEAADWNVAGIQEGFPLYKQSWAPPLQVAVFCFSLLSE